MFSNHARQRHGILMLAPTVGLALALAGCSTGSADGGSESSAKVAAIIKGLDNTFFQAMEDGINDTGSADGVDVTVQAAADINDETGQADKLTTMAGQDFGCFVINPISANNLIQGLTTVSEAGATIVNIDNPLDPDAVKAAGIELATYVGTDNTAAGGKAGDFVISKVSAGSEVAVIGGVSGNVTSGERVDGFRTAVGQTVTVVQEEAADWNRELALTKATDIIAAHPNIAAFFAANDDMGLGIVKAVENAGLAGKIVVVSVDGNKDALESVAAGGLSATVAQYPYAIGALGVQACEVAAAGGTLPKSIESPTALVTADVAADAIKAFPQPFEGFDNPLTDLLGK